MELIKRAHMESLKYGRNPARASGSQKLLTPPGVGGYVGIIPSWRKAPASGSKQVNATDRDLWGDRSGLHSPATNYNGRY